VNKQGKKIKNSRTHIFLLVLTAFYWWVYARNPCLMWFCSCHQYFVILFQYPDCQPKFFFLWTFLWPWNFMAHNEHANMAHCECWSVGCYLQIIQIYISFQMETCHQEHGIYALFCSCTDWHTHTLMAHTCNTQCMLLT
jgi:hypothetical protein